MVGCIRVRICLRADLLAPSRRLRPIDPALRWATARSRYHPRTMMPARQPGVTRRSQARALLARKDDFGVVLVMVLLTVIVFAAADGPVGQLVSVALSGGTLLFVLHTAGAHRRTFRASAVVVVLAS